MFHNETQATPSYESLRLNKYKVREWHEYIKQASLGRGGTAISTGFPNRRISGVCRMSGAASAMKYELTGKIKPSEFVRRQEAKVKREVNINLMSTSQVLWFLVVRHKFELLMVWAVCATVLAVLGL